MIRPQLTYFFLPGILFLTATTGLNAADWKEPPRGVADWPEEMGDAQATQSRRWYQDAKPGEPPGGSQCIGEVRCGMGAGPLANGGTWMPLQRRH